MALPHDARLPRALIAAKGVRRTFAFGSVKLLPPPPRVAVVASKKVFKTAPARNRIRRRISEILRTARTQGVFTHAVVAYPSANALRAPHAALKEALLRAVSN